MSKAPPVFLLKEDRVYLQGDFTFQTVGKMGRTIKKFILTLPAVVAVDLQRVNLLDSACLALLLAFTREADKRGKALHFANIPDKMLALAKVSGVATILFNPKQ